MNTIASIKDKHILFEYQGDKNAPYFICIGGIHGNEHGGLKALQKVIQKIDSDNLELKGSFLAIKGNFKAIQERKRFIDRDLNRMFYKEMITSVQNKSFDELTSNEEMELRNIISIIAPYIEIAAQNKPVFLLDLHTTSAYGGLFTISSKSKLGIEIGKRVGVPVIIGINDVIKGTTVNFCEQFNMTGFAFEGGQHDDPVSVVTIEAAIWLFLEATGLISKNSISDFNKYKDTLLQYGALFPDVVEFKFRHHVQPNDKFEMNPGMKNFMHVDKGQIIAKDKNGEIKAPKEGMLLMPLYQKQGEDGFFIIEKHSELILT